MLHTLAQTGLLDPESWLSGGGTTALALVCAIVFAEVGLLLGFFLPGDTLLFFTGIITLSGQITQPLWLVVLLVTAATTLGGELGYEIGRRSGPAVFDKRESGLFSRASVARAEGFFERFGPATVAIARFVAIVRTFVPVVAGVAVMRRRTFSFFNLVGAAAWSTTLIVLGYELGKIPVVSDFVSAYLDLILVALIVVCVTPVLVRVVRTRRAARA
ncbi:membrane-associated protein [Sediminihabitans luteus]|uniref:Membrane-associated protein n=1 Tax=Sediminihabitans luteus TaxID=1138585 RepID=A0A2M9D0B0_9CELL|nr:VTT domain-containing protein [Sediminihabitans luteus]PJJ77587.1 membrane-associated protein [Sediminihabitans luteus]GII98487.1 membrane protein [Sediminihabitans luteus]